MADVPLAFQDLVKQTEEMRQQLLLAQADLTEMELTRTTSDGLVTVTMKGDGVVTRVAFDQAVFDERDAESLGALTVAAITQATDAVKSLCAERMTAICASFEDATGVKTGVKALY